VYPGGVIDSSYRTYEEWKLNADQKAAYTESTGSYRTYEEWKPSLIKAQEKAMNFVLTVPMRNGNTIQKAYPKTLVLFLPYL